jgi:hypothetical protein
MFRSLEIGIYLKFGICHLEFEDSNYIGLPRLPGIKQLYSFEWIPGFR